MCEGVGVMSVSGLCGSNRNANQLYGVSVSYRKKQDAVDLILLKQQQEESRKYGRETKIAI